MKRKTFFILFAIVAAILIVMPSLAASYIYSFTLQETGGTSYTLAPIYATVNNSALVTGKYITSTGLDTRVTSGGSSLKRMLTTSGLWFTSPITASRTQTDYYTFGNSAETSMPVILGNNGYITTTDAAALEPSNHYDIESQGYVDTTASVYPDNYLTVSGTNTNGTTHTFNLPTGYAVNDLLVVVIGLAGNTNVSSWTKSFTELVDTNSTVSLTVA